MLNEKRVIIMTKMASYENTEGKKNGTIGKYYRGDYIGLQVVKSIIFATIASLLICAMYILYDFENIMANIYKMDLLATGKRFLFIFIVIIAVYALISYAIYSYRYSKARRKQKIYASHLKQLGELYDKDSKKTQS